MKIHDQLETRPIDGLIPYARNSRTHSPEQVAQIAASIKEFGFTNPVLVDETGGVIAGHGRIMAARQLGLAAVPCLRLDGLSEAQKRAYVIADNKIALNAGWDEELLRIELDELTGFDIDLLGMTGFNQAELDELLWASNCAPADSMPVLPVGEKLPLQQMAFILHDSQAEQVKRAIDVANKFGAYKNTQNENGNGNALARICEAFLVQAAHG